MDLKIKDVAELLNVSETTIRRWLADNKIPAYRLNHQYRFNRLEIEKWVMDHKLGKNQSLLGAFQAPIPAEATTVDTSSKNSRGSKQFSLYRAIHKGGVIHYSEPYTTKESLIRPVIKSVAAGLELDADLISDYFLEREALQSTALNNGIAIPHTRDFFLNAHFDAVAVVFPDQPIPFDALDGKPVHTFFFLFASDDRRHLHLLAKIAHLCSNQEMLEFLKTKPHKDALLEHIKSWESSIPQAKD